MFKRIDHVALVVPDLDQAVNLYRETFGLEPAFRDRNEEQGFEEVGFQVGDAHIDLLASIRSDSVIAGFLQKRGPGLHHIGLEVEDLDACLEQVRAKDLRLTGNDPRQGTGGSRIAFVHPKSLLGTMLELVERPED
jgi:methylmalonyl-CoA/ethylmalonyl-CoA epimerase